MPSQWKREAWSLPSKGFTHQCQTTPSHCEKTASKFHVKERELLSTSHVHVERGQESKLEASERNGVTTAGYLQ